jgi:hypothetical protein
VVEREIELRELRPREPAGLSSIVSPARRLADRFRVVEDAHRMSAGVAIGIGVDAENLSDPHLDPGLLVCLARARLFRRLSPFAEAAGERPAAHERRTPAAHEQDPPAWIFDPRIDR